MTTLTRAAAEKSAQIRYCRFTVDDQKFHADDATDIGPHVRLRTIGLPEIESYERVPYDEKGEFQSSRLPLRRRKLIQLAWVDNDGEPVYSHAEIGKMQMGGDFATMLFNAAVKFTGIDSSERVTIADAKKNSEPTDDSETPIGSALNSESMIPSGGIKTPTPTS